MEKTKKLLKNNQALFLSFSEISQVINSSLEANKILEHLIDVTLEIMGAERGFILFLDKESGDFNTKVARNINHSDIESPSSKVSHSVIQNVMENHEFILTNDAPHEQKLAATGTIAREGIRSILCGPIKANDEIYGIIYIDDKRNIANLFSKEDLEALKAVCNLAAVAIKNATLYTELKKSYKDTVKCLVNVIMKKDPYTKGHSERVSDYALLIGKKLGLNDKKMEDLEFAAILHDIGKIGIKEEILTKSSKLTDGEWAEIQKHPPFGYEIMSPLSVSEEVKQAILHHQEKYNGTGYPDKLQGENIPLLARIIAVADTYDAMTSTRAYRVAFTKETALEELNRCKGTQLDPSIVDAFLAVL